VINLLGQRIKELRKINKMTQQDLADKLKLAKSTISQYENSVNEPDNLTMQRIADIFEVSVDYLLGRTNENNTITVSGKEINLSPEELKLFEELKKHPAIFHDLASDPEKKVKELIKLYKMKKMFLEDDEEEYGNGFGEFED